MKKRLKGSRIPKIRTVCSCHSGRWVRQKPVQMDLFDGDDWFYHDRELLYVSKEKNVSAS